MKDTPIEDRYALADYITNPETETAWVSPVGLDESLDYLTQLPDTYDAVDDVTRIADLGCGDGTLTVALAEEYPDAEVVGIDIASKYAQDAVDAYREETGQDNATIVEGDVYDILSDDNANGREELEPFDVVYAVNVFQDLPDFPAAVEAVSDATREEAYVGGTFTGENAKHLFGEFLEYDEEEDAEFWEFGDIELDEDTTVSLRQRIIPESEAVATFGDYGFEPIERQELAADDEYLEQALNLLNPDNDTDADALSPAYPFYLFYRGEYDADE